MCLLLPFLRLRSRQSLMVIRLSVRKSYSCLEEKACRSDSMPASRVLVLQQTTGQCDSQATFKRPCVLQEETHLLSNRLSMHCLSLSSMISCSDRSSTSTAGALANGWQATLVAALPFERSAAQHTHLHSSQRFSHHWHCWELQTQPHPHWSPSPL